MSAGRFELKTTSDRVYVSNTALNMISSLHLSRPMAKATLENITSSVLDTTKAAPLPGVENGFVARAGKFRVLFRRKGDTVHITSVIPNT